jgi:hypothetical protein
MRTCSARDTSARFGDTADRPSRIPLRSLLLVFALASLIGCGNKKEDAPPPNPLAWSAGHYLCDRLPSPDGKPTCKGEADLTIVAGVVKGTVRQSTNNLTGTLPDVIDITYDFTGPLTLGADGNATFDISGQIPSPSPGSYHVYGDVRPKGMIGVKAQCTVDLNVAEIEPVSDLDSHVDMNKEAKIAPRKFIKKQFALAGEGIGFKH